jgi:serine/threonine-protein kinase
MTGPDRRGEELLGKALGPYVVDYRLGSGATGVVFRGHEQATGAVVALKVLNENLGTISSLRRRFEREARLLTRLDHPNIVHIAGFGVQEQYTYIAMELLEGTTLEQVLDEAPLEPGRALEVMREMLKGLAFAHQQGIVHRDLKPANVFLLRPAERASQPDGERASQPDRPKDRVKLLDFGLAKMLSDEPGAEGEDGTLTRKGRIVGTPAYMAPEQITGVSLDVRADVYAAGILLYELLADRRPFLSERRSELLRAHLLSAPPPLATAREGLEVHPELEGLLQKALEKNPNDRFPHAQAMLEALEALPRRPARLAGGERSVTRSRSGATSEVISSSERRAVSESISSDPNKPPSIRPQPEVIAPSQPLAGMASLDGAPAPARDRTKEPTHRVRTVPQPPEPRGLSTPMLYLLAGVLFAFAAVLWLVVGRS